MGWDCTKDRVVAFDKRPEPLNNPVLGCEQHLLVKDLQLWSSLPGNNHLQRQDVSDLHADNEYRIDCAQHEKLPGVCLGQRCHLDSVFFTCAIVAMSTHGCKVHVTGNHRERTVSFVLNWKILIQTCGLSNNRLSSVGPAIRVCCGVMEENAGHSFWKGKISKWSGTTQLKQAEPYIPAPSKHGS